MSWNYRIIKHGSWYGIRDVYYDENGKPDSWGVGPPDVAASNLDSLKSELELILRAFDKPVLVIQGNELVEETE